ncbi:MAG: magnesium and cobalt transport protein CorA [Chloroflexi bacterium RBG_13_51_18]|nr:MAG: magnesium and cobalt transport protein CorA [Chloroflexi bacterium RBG_13_51_18]
MRRLIRKRSEKAGLPPGTLVYVGEKKVENVKITIIDYDETQITEKEAAAIEECFPFKDKPTVTWINIDGLHEVDIIEKLGNHFGLHPLLLEDILNTEQRPKMEESENYIFFVLKMIFSVDEDKEIKAEQVSLILGHNFVISFQEREGDVFNPVRDRIRKSKGRIRKVGADYLAYALLDAIVDSYFSVLENVGEKIEDTEQQLTLNPTTQTLQLIRKLKNEMIFLRKSIWPLRELISGFLRLETSLVQQATGVYIRDVYDHTIQVIDTIESYRDMISGMLDIYLSSLSNKMNEVMKVLTIFASIFIPLTFVAGVYGMNFENMPELKWQWGYFGLLGFMALIGITLVLYFKRKKWL